MPPCPAGAVMVKRLATTVPAGREAAWRAEGARGAGRRGVLSMERSLSDLRLRPALPGQLQGASILGHLEHEALAGGFVWDVRGALAQTLQCLAQSSLTFLGITVRQAGL